MSVIYAYIDPSNHPNVGKYAIHGVSGTGSNIQVSKSSGSKSCRISKPSMVIRAALHSGMMRFCSKWASHRATSKADSCSLTVSEIYIYIYKYHRGLLGNGHKGNHIYIYIPFPLPTSHHLHTRQTLQCMVNVEPYFIQA